MPQEDHIYRVVELAGTSDKSIEDAVATAIGRANQTIRNLRWFSGLLVLFLTSQVQAALPLPDGWKTYVDEQYGTRVEYPSWFSMREGEPALGPGERLVTPDKRAEIEIYSLPNQARHTPRSYLAEKMRLNPLMLHYERVTPRFFVLSAAANDRIYYTRCNFSERAGGTIHCVYLGYPQSEKRDWDQIVTRVSLSLRP